MDAIRIHKVIDSETLHLPELKPLIGKAVEIVVREEQPAPRWTEQDWQKFFAENGTDFVDPDAYKQQREFDRQHWRPHGT